MSSSSSSSSRMSESNSVRSLDEELAIGADDCDVVQLVPAEGDPIRVSKAAALMSSLLQSVFSSDREAVRVRVELVNRSTLELVAQYLEHHAGVDPPEIPIPVRSIHMSEIVGPWDAKFADSLSNSTVFDVAAAANYLHVRPLLFLMCAKIATKVKNRSPDEIASVLDV